jgi:hypothetical protein
MLEIALKTNSNRNRDGTNADGLSLRVANAYVRGTSQDKLYDGT